MLLCHCMALCSTPAWIWIRQVWATWGLLPQCAKTVCRSVSQKRLSLDITIRSVFNQAWPANAPLKPLSATSVSAGARLTYVRSDLGEDNKQRSACSSHCGVTVQQAPIIAMVTRLSTRADEGFNWELARNGTEILCDEKQELPLKRLFSAWQKLRMWW